MPFLFNLCDELKSNAAISSQFSQIQQPEKVIIRSKKQ